MKTIVMDTNVMAQGGNENPEGMGELSRASRELFTKLIDADTIWCLDQGFSLDPAENHSQIMTEYLAKAPPGALGMAVLSELAASGRVSGLQRPDLSIRRVIRQLVWDQSDWRFAEIAHSSAEKTLVTHDRTNFPEQCKRQLKRRIGVVVVEASDAVASISTAD